MWLAAIARLDHESLDEFCSLVEVSGEIWLYGRAQFFARGLVVGAGCGNGLIGDEV